MKSYMHNFTLEKKSEIWNAFTLFKNWKVNLVFLSLISRMKSEMKMPWDREWKVKWKCLEIEIKKWNVNKILENSRETRLSQVTEKWWQKETKIGRNFCHQNWWYFRHLKTHQFLQITKIFTKIGDKKTQNWVQLLSPELVKFSSLKNSPIYSNHQNLHQNWWQKKHKIGWNYCHQKWWNFRHLKTHQFLQITKIFTEIGDNFGENSIENSNHQNFHQNWWKIWRKFNRKWMWSPTSSKVWKVKINLGKTSIEKQCFL